MKTLPRNIFQETHFESRMLLDLFLKFLFELQES
jgi:hypothetical protein